MKSPKFLAVILALGLGAYVTFTAGPAWAPPPPAIQGEKILKCAVITTPGFYRLIKNLPAGGGLLANGNCIEVTVDNVTIDLAGYTMTGDGTGDGIANIGARQGIAVRDGTITGFNSGVRLDITSGAKVEWIRALDNDEFGIATGNHSIVTGNIANGNGFSGIFTAGSNTITGNIASNNGGDGIFADFRSTVTGNTARSNSGDGIQVESESTVAGNTSSDNDFIGLVARSRSTITGNTANDNGTDGISASGANTITGNTASKNADDGFALGFHNTVTGNTAVDNDDDGISVQCASNIRGNMASDNNQGGGTGVDFRQAFAFGGACNLDNNLFTTSAGP